MEPYGPGHETRKAQNLKVGTIDRQYGKAMVMLQTQRHEGRFFGRRVNCEEVPLLPAWTVAQVFGECVHITPHDSDRPIEGAGDVWEIFSKCVKITATLMAVRKPDKSSLRTPHVRLAR